MTVIAKMYALTTPRTFPEEQQIDLACVCDDRLFTINEPVPGRVAENQTFSTATPSGDCRFHMSKDFPIRRQEEFYLIFQKEDECPAYAGAIMVSKVRCVSVTDFGGTSKSVEVCSEHRPYPPSRGAEAPAPKHPRQSWTFNMRMMIDNPAASIQWEPGKGGYWLGIYRASDFDMHEALADAHSPTEDA